MPEPRITPAMVRRLKARFRRCDRMPWPDEFFAVIDEWAKTENARRKP